MDWKRIVVPLLISVLVVIVDQFLKFESMHRNFPQLVNRGVALGVFSDIKSSWFVLLIQLLVLGFLCLMVVRNKTSKDEQLALGMLFGGGISNGIDRLNYGGVVDYMDIGIGVKFNLADCFIVFSVIYLLLKTVSLKISKSQVDVGN